MLSNSFNKYYYLVKLDLIDRTNNQIYNIDSNLLAMRIINDYENHIFPIIEVQLSLDYTTYQIIRDNQVQARMDLKKRVSNSSTDNIESNEDLYEESIVFNNLIFEIVDKNKIEYSERDMNSEVPSIEINFSLFYTGHLKTNKILFNGNYLDCRLIDVLAFLNNINETKLLIEKPSNNKVYNQILVPPINAPKLADYLQETYTIYKNGLRTFFDFNEYYILNNKLSNTTPVKDNDYKNVIFDIVEDDDTNALMPNNYGYKANRSDYYYIKTDSKNLNISNTKHIKEEIFGTHKIILDINDDLNIERNEYEDENKIINKTKVYYDLYNNPYNPFDVNTIDTNRKTALFRFSTLDMDTFKCNKKFLCSKNNQDYIFKVDKVIFVLIKDKNSGVMNCNGVCKLSEN